MTASASPFDWNNVVLLAIAALAAWNAYRSQERDKKVAAVAEVAVASKVKVEEISKTADELHTLTNGSFSKTVAALELSVSENKGLREQIAMMMEAKKTADALATQVATAAPTPNATQRIELPVANPPSGA